MNFCSLKYGYFLLILIPCYFAVPKRIQKYVLLLFSIVFYLSFSVKAFVIMTLTGIITYAASLWIGKEKDRRKRKPLLVLSITLDLGILVLLKYSDFLSHITGLKWLSVINTGVIERYSLVLPLGISFYTLSLIGYLIDVYREKVTPETNFFVFYLFETFSRIFCRGRLQDIIHWRYSLKRSMNLNIIAFVTDCSSCSGAI